MRIVVCVKQVPDTWSEKRLDPADQTLDRAAAEGVIDELDTYAVEAALRMKEAKADAESTVVVLTMGPAGAADTVRKALAMGADEAVHVVDDALHGSDAIATSLVLGERDRVASASTSSCWVLNRPMPAWACCRRCWPSASACRRQRSPARSSLDGATLRVQRQAGTDRAVVTAELPALISVLEKINEPRYPSFKGIMAAKTKPTTTWSLADLGIDAASVGLAGAATEVIDSAEREGRARSHDHQGRRRCRHAHRRLPRLAQASLRQDVRRWQTYSYWSTSSTGIGKPTFELLTLAARLGTPVAVVVGAIDDADATSLGTTARSVVLTATDDSLLTSSVCARRSCRCSRHWWQNASRSPS